MKPLSGGEELPTSSRDEECGFGRCRPKLLQVFARIQWFVGVYSISALLSSTMSSFVNSQVPMLEKQFGFSSSQSGLLMSCNDIGYLCCVIFAGYIARKVHIPRGLGVATFMYGVCGIMCAMPYFIQDKSTYDLDTDTSNIAANVSHISSRFRIPMCIPGYGNTSRDIFNGTKSCSDVGSAQAEDVQQLTYKKVAFTLIAAGMVLQGAGKSVRGPFVTLYVDDGADKRQTGFLLGIVMGTAIFGPALAYFLGGYFNKIYVTLEAVGISPRDPRWIGAWWLGFIVFGATSIVCCIPLFCFPRRLRNKRDAAINDSTKAQMMTKKTYTGIPLLHEGKVFLLSVLRVLRNPVFSLTSASSCINCLALAGILAFLSKYISVQYSIPLWQANMIMGACSILAYSIGSFCSGFLSRRMQMTPQNSILALVIFTGISLSLFACGLFFGCDQPALLRDVTRSTPQEDGYAPANRTCASECACRDQYFPVCGDRGLTYYSPCHAGCTQQEAMTFSNCTCIPSGMARSGICDQGCSTNLYVFAVVTFSSCLVDAFKIVPSILINIRCVEKRDRAVATAVSGFLMSCLGFMPGPVIFGRIVDGACSLWRYTCGQRQDCRLYDIVHFRKALHAYGLTLKFIPLCLLIGLYVYFRIKKITVWRHNDTDAPNPTITADGKDKLHNELHVTTRS